MRIIFSTNQHFSISSYSKKCSQLVLHSQSPQEISISFYGVRAFSLQCTLPLIKIYAENIAHYNNLPAFMQVEYDKKLLIYRLITEKGEGHVLAMKSKVSDVIYDL